MAYLMHDQIRSELSQWLTPTLRSLGASEAEASQLYSGFASTPDTKMGQLAFALFPWAKLLKQNPAQLSGTLAKTLESDPGKPKWLKEVRAVGPYLNFFYDPGALASVIVPQILSGEFFKKKLSQNMPKTMIEFSQPNTHKEMHVGHMRNLCLGDALIRLHRYCGFDIVASTFPGDVGTHVAKCLWFYKNFNTEKPPLERKGAWLGTLYSKAHNKLEDERGSDKEESNRKQLTEILAQLEKKEGEYFELWKETRQWSIDLMNEVYKWADVKFDAWYWESEVDSDSVKLVREWQKKGLFVEDQGAVGADLKEYGLGFCLLLKTDGNGLYATKDIELARRKFQERGIEKSVYVVDLRQSHHFKQVFKVLELMGFEHAKDCFHLQYDFVELPDGAMSSRKGNIVPLQALVDNMVAMIKKEHLHRYENEWSADEIEQTAQDVARGAIKYGMTRIDPTKKIVFAMDEWLKLDGESGPYLQYTYARIQSLSRKLNQEKLGAADYSSLTQPQEAELIRLLPQFNTIVTQACEQYRPSVLTAYLYDVAKGFNAFYSECPVASAPSGQKEARLSLALAAAEVINVGLKLLGIPSPSKM
ncbi:MAG: arginine--tRNA ligase [Bacteriovoracaceae bacterium]|nr:arginine--tRNA ligase [Bacteriovoracaceae bacterium]